MKPPAPRRHLSSESFRALYEDRGCDLHDACLTCPFARCRYDSAPTDDLTLPPPIVDRTARR